jgi:hypothetical protein
LVLSLLSSINNMHQTPYLLSSREMSFNDCLPQWHRNEVQSADPSVLGCQCGLSHVVLQFIFNLHQNNNNCLNDHLKKTY